LFGASNLFQNPRNLWNTSPGFVPIVVYGGTLCAAGGTARCGDWEEQADCWLT
jgi:hypothetical protein